MNEKVYDEINANHFILCRMDDNLRNVFCPTASEKNLVVNGKAIFQITLGDGGKSSMFSLEAFLRD